MFIFNYIVYRLALSCVFVVIHLFSSLGLLFGGALQNRHVLHPFKMSLSTQFQIRVVPFEGCFVAPFFEDKSTPPRHPSMLRRSINIPLGMRFPRLGTPFSHTLQSFGRCAFATTCALRDDTVRQTEVENPIHLSHTHCRASAASALAAMQW